MYEETLEGSTVVTRLKYILHPDGMVDMATAQYQYPLKDHLGNTRLVVSQNGKEIQQSAYYPFGLAFMQTINSDNKYLYSGKELQDDKLNGVKLDWYDYGARMYDAALGRWFVSDPAKELYWNYSPYNYAQNNPVNAIDPDGNIVIFINGFALDKESQGTSKYWRTEEINIPVHIQNGAFSGYSMSSNTFSREFDIAVLDQLGDDHAMYVHGGNTLFAGFRVVEGYYQGKLDVEQIIKSIVDENGNPKETIKIISHSMGGAFAKGYVLALKKYIKENGYNNVLITLEADFDPYQAGSLSTIDNVFTMQFSHNKSGDGEFSWLANQRQNNLDDDNYVVNKDKGSHSITTFLII